MVPDLGAKVTGREDGGGVYPDIVEYVGAERGDKGKGMGIKVGDARDVAEEVSLDEFLLQNPKFLAAVINDGVLVRVAVSNKGAGRGGEEVGEEVR